MRMLTYTPHLPSSSTAVSAADLSHCHNSWPGNTEEHQHAAILVSAMADGGWHHSPPSRYSVLQLTWRLEEQQLLPPGSGDTVLPSWLQSLKARPLPASATHLSTASNQAVRLSITNAASCPLLPASSRGQLQPLSGALQS